MLNNNLIVLPTSRAIRQFRLAELSSNKLLPKYVSIGDFFQRAVLDGKNRNFCDKNLKILYLKEAVKSSALDKLGLSYDFNTFIKQSEYIFRFFKELSNEYVQFDTLLNYDTYTHYGDHIEILKEIYKNYCLILDQNGFVDNITLSESFKINQDYILQFETVTLYLEGYLSKFEQKILKQISEIVPLEVIFSLNRFNKKNIEFFELEDELLIDRTYKINLSLKKVVSSKKDISRTEDIVISPVSSTIEQIAFIKYRLTEMVNSGIDPEKIALIVPDEKIADLIELFDGENYFNFAMGKNIKKGKAVQTLRHIAKLLTDFEPKDNEVSRFLELDIELFTNLFKNNWKRKLNRNIFNETFDYLFTLEQEEEIVEKLQSLKISLELLLFSKNFTEQIIFYEFIKLLQTEISNITVDDTKGGKVTVLGILETRLVEFEGIIVCDFNDEKVPKISVKDKFISSRLKELCSLPTSKDRENLQKYYYKRVFDKAKSLAICYVNDESSVISRFLIELFPDYKNRIQTKNYFSVLFKTNNIKQLNKDIILDIDLSLRSWSATALKTYLTCKRKYYLRYIANIKDHTVSIKPQSIDIGNIIHDCLDSAVKNDSLNESFIRTYLSGESKNNPYLVLELELWKRKLDGFLKLEEKRKKQNITVYKTEVPFNINFQGINIKGKIDRIDKYPDNTYEILDYKTSSNLKIDTIKTYESSKDFQLEFYYLASRDKMIKDVAYYDLASCEIKNEILLKEKLELLNIHFQTLKTTRVDFNKTENSSDCQFCSYRTICDR